MPKATFSQVILLVPAATLLHVLEEWPGFPRWARRFASPHYTDREYLVVHGVGLATSLVAALVVSRFPSPWLLVPFFAFLVGPGIFWNALFHVGATFVSRTYCPGAVTGLLLYAPLSGIPRRCASDLSISKLRVRPSGRRTSASSPVARQLRRADGADRGSSPGRERCSSALG
jgi:hypothetical protein